MSAKKFVNGSHLENPLTVEARQARLELSADTVSIHKSGIEFRSPTPFTEWAEMTVTLQSPVGGNKITCAGVIIACTGNKHTGYHVSMVFTSMTETTEKQLRVMSRSEFGVS